MGALAAYPWLGCTGGPYEVWTRWGVSEDLYCAGRETTFTFIEHVLSEILALFPSRQIHIGDDECPVTRWQDCPQCRRRMQTERLADETAGSGSCLRSHPTGLLRHPLSQTVLLSGLQSDGRSRSLRTSVP